MTPLNQPERRTRLWQFALLYLLALLLPLGASYYFFSNNSLGDENARLKKELDANRQEQQLLVARFDTLNQQLRRIDAVDQRLRDEKNDLVLGQLNTRNQDYLNDIAVTLSQLRADSARFQVPTHRLLARDELRDFNLFRANRSTIDALRGQVAKNGSSAQQSAHVAEELAQTKAELGQAKQQVIMLQASLNRPPMPSGGGGGGGAVAGPSAAVKQQLALLQDQIAFANADCLRQLGLSKKPHSKERRQLLEQARTAFIAILQEPATEDLKLSIEKTLEPINVELGRPPRFFGLLAP